MARPQALIFDMDGLLMDTEGLYKRSWTKAALEAGFDLTDALYLKLIGITVADAEQVLAGDFGKKFPLDTFRTRAKILYEELHESEGMPMKPGVRELLVWAQEHNIPCAVGTSTVYEEAKKRLMHHDVLQYFKVVIGGDMVDRGKPHPDIFLKAQAALGVPAANCLVLEDAHNGLLAASAGGMRSCLVPDLLPPSAESEAIAEAIFSSLHEVREWLALDCPAAKEKAES
jgi:beta-phosphoglucomutase-like phosphatase (HAD superfamily)